MTKTKKRKRSLGGAKNSYLELLNKAEIKDVIGNNEIKDVIGNNNNSFGGALTPVISGTQESRLKRLEQLKISKLKETIKNGEKLLETKSYLNQGFYKGQEDYSLGQKNPNNINVVSSIVETQLSSVYNTHIQLLNSLAIENKNIIYLGHGGYGFAYKISDKIVIKFFYDIGDINNIKSYVTTNLIQMKLLGINLHDYPLEFTSKNGNNEVKIYALLTEYLLCSFSAIISINNSVFSFKEFLRINSNDKIKKVLLKNMCSAMSVFHKKDLIHGDIKLENMICHPYSLFITLIDYDFVFKINHNDYKDPKGGIKYTFYYKFLQKMELLTEYLDFEYYDKCCIMLSYLNVMYDIHIDLEKHDEEEIYSLSKIFDEKTLFEISYNLESIKADKHYQRILDELFNIYNTDNSSPSSQPTSEKSSPSSQSIKEISSPSSQPMTEIKGLSSESIKENSSPSNQPITELKGTYNKQNFLGRFVSSLRKKLKFSRKSAKLIGHDK